MTTDERRATLEAFARALNREAHNLRRWPQITWQQLYNRLQWEEEPLPQLLAPELARRTAPGAAPWLRLRTPIPESRHLIGTLAGHSGFVSACAVTPDGASIVSVGVEGALKVWDAHSLKELRTVVPGEEQWTGAGAATLSPDGSLLALVSGGTVRLWDLAPGRQIRTFESDLLSFRGFNCCALSPDGRQMVAGDADGKVWIWDISGQELNVLPGHAGNAVSACAVSPDGAFVVSGSSDGSLKVWDIAAGREALTLEGHGGDVSDCAVGPEASFIASAGGGVMKLWDLSSGECLQTLEGPRRFVVSPDSASIIASHGFTIKVWDVAAGEERASLEGHTGRIRDCAVSPDGSFVVSASMDETLKIWDPAVEGETVPILGHPQGLVNACAMSPVIKVSSRGVEGEDAMLVSGGSDGTLMLHRASTGEPAGGWQAHDSAVRGCAVSPDGTWIVSADDNLLNFWNLITREKLSTWEAFAGAVFVHGCALSIDGSLIVAASDETVQVWDTTAGSELASLKGHARRVNACAISPDLSFVVTASDDGTLKLWDPRSGEALRTLEGHDSGVYGCAVAPDASFLVSASFDNTLKIWDPATGEGLRTLKGHNDFFVACAVSPDGQFVVSAADGLKVWDAQGGTEIGGIPLAGNLSCVALHPSRPLVWCGDRGGALHLIEPVPMAYGPIIVTALDFGQGAQVPCPYCIQVSPLNEEWLGQVIDCPRCQGRMRVNPFIAGSAKS